MIQTIGLPTARAALQLRAGNPAKAIELLATPAPYELGVGFPYLPVYVRGLASLRAGGGADAKGAFQKILDNPGVDALSVMRPLAQLGLARGAALAGDAAGSRRAYQDFMALWKDADLDIPVLREARAEYAKLGDRGGGSRVSGERRGHACAEPICPRPQRFQNSGAQRDAALESRGATSGLSPR